MKLDWLIKCGRQMQSVKRLSSEVYKRVCVWALVKVFAVGERDGLTLRSLSSTGLFSAALTILTNKLRAFGSNMWRHIFTEFTSVIGSKERTSLAQVSWQAATPLLCVFWFPPQRRFTSLSMRTCCISHFLRHRNDAGSRPSFAKMVEA